MRTRGVRCHHCGEYIAPNQAVVVVDDDAYHWQCIVAIVIHWQKRNIRDVDDR